MKRIIGFALLAATFALMVSFFVAGCDNSAPTPPTSQITSTSPSSQPATTIISAAAPSSGASLTTIISGIGNAVLLGLAVYQQFAAANSSASNKKSLAVALQTAQQIATAVVAHPDITTAANAGIAAVAATSPQAAQTVYEVQQGIGIAATLLPGVPVLQQVNAVVNANPTAVPAASVTIK